MSAINRLLTEVRSKLAPDNRTALDQVVKEPAVARYLAGAEDAHVAERRTLAEALAAAPGKYEAAAAKAYKVAAAAAKRAADARAALSEAMDSHRSAQIQADGLQSQLDTELARLTAELIGTADPRLAQLIRDLRGFTTGPLRSGLVFTIVDRGGRFDGGRITEVLSNGPALRDVTARVDEVIAKARDAQMQALRHGEVTQLIRTWLTELAPHLRPYGLTFIELNESGDLVRTREDLNGVALGETMARSAEGLPLEKVDV